MTRILAIESSCDETAAAVVTDGRVIESSVVSSQIDLHARFGGVVPEIAGRAHVERIVPVVAQALGDAGLGTDGTGIDVVAATVGPGLIGSLLVGVSAAKAYAWAWGTTFFGVNHLEAHLYSPFLEHEDVELPLVTLIVSGGHTLLVLLETPTRYRVLGSTLDDAAGEAFDKVARFLGLGYPGGPSIEREAAVGNPAQVRFPRALMGDGLDFSFSGVKTSVVNYVRKHPDAATPDIAASFQDAVVEVLVAKLRRAADAHAAKGIAIGGGVAANSLLRARVVQAAAEDGRRSYVPPRAMCTDNAAMVAAAAWWRLPVDGPTPLSAGADPNLRLRR